MKLNTFERLILLNILPAEGDFTTLKIVRKLRETLSFSESEHKELGIKTGDPAKPEERGRVFWKQEADKEKDVVIGEKATDIIVAALRQLSEAKKLREEHLALYEKFIPGV